jgi:aspartyl protease family protein
MRESKPVASERLLWIVIAALGAAVVALALRHHEGTVAGMQVEQFAQVAYLLALLVLVTGFGYFFLRSRLGVLLRAATFWIFIAAALALAYTYRFEIEAISERVIAEFVNDPITIANGNGATVQVARARGGAFSTRAHVNGAAVTMIVDTGASSVVLTHDAAKAANLPIDLLKYDVPIETASGRTRAAAVVLERIAVGGIIERRVPALVSPPGELRTSLLGMTFLNRLQSYEVKGGRLLMRAKQ